MNVLIVDDDYVDREHIKRTLLKGDAACRFTETESVDEAIESFREQQYDVVLLDYRMPQRDGIELVLELRNVRVEHSVAIVMLSNSEDDEIALECVRAGAQDFLVKSEISTSRLRRAIQHAQSRFALEQKLLQSYRDARQLAEQDTLTGLANRFVFEENLRLGIANNQRQGHKLALMLFDLDHFKFVNDNYGHDVGDVLLKCVVERVRQCLRGNELFARLGGDEFAIVLSNLKRAQSVSNVARRVQKALEKPFDIAGIEARIGVSIGIAIHPDNSVQGDELLKFADIAMYRAKKLGRNRIVFFEEAMQQQFLQRYEVENKLKEALQNDQLRLQYQPIIACGDERLLGFEALLRWQIEPGRTLFPDAFIAIAEETGQIIQIGRWVIEQSLAQLQQWQRRSATPLQLSINLSAVQLHDPKLLQHITACLKKNRVPATRVEFEITETAFIDYAEEHAGLLQKIVALGCRVALDDFGTGFSSVSHLHRFPIDTVKIDKSLMMAPKDDKTLALIRGLALMIQTLGIEIVAEGIEEQSSLQLCQQLNIDRVQGYYFSRPLAPPDIESGLLAAPALKLAR